MHNVPDPLFYIGPSPLHLYFLYWLPLLFANFILLLLLPLLFVLFTWLTDCAISYVSLLNDSFFVITELDFSSLAYIVVWFMQEGVKSAEALA